MNAWRATVALAALLCVTSGHAQTEAASAEWAYRVQPGDTLIALTEQWLVAPRGWRDLQRLNHVRDPLRLKPGSTLRMPLDWVRQEASVAHAVFVRGEVVHQHGDDTQPLLAGASLRSGDRIRTGPKSSASLRFADGSRLLIPAGSDITLEQLLALGREAIPTVRLGVRKGSADSLVTPNARRLPIYEVRTPHVNLGVRGTEFRVQADDASSRMQVLAGGVHAGGVARDVPAGQGLRVDATAHAVTPLLPAPDLSAMAKLADRLPLRLSWPASPQGAVAWRAQLYVKDHFDQLLLDARVEQPGVTWHDARELADGDYSLRVRAIDVHGHEGFAADVTIALQARPEPPLIQAPAPDAVSYDGGFALAWSRNVAAPRVRLQVARDAQFKDVVLEQPAIDAAGFDARLPDGAYHWRIAAVEAGGRAGPFSDAQGFEIKPPPPSPPPATPEASGNELTLRWRVDPQIVRTEVELAKAEDFSGADVKRFSTNEPQLTIAKPGPGTHYLRARSFNAAGAASPWGQTQVIEQPASPKSSAWWVLLPLLLVPLL